jgi:hypothetical protein
MSTPGEAETAFENSSRNWNMPAPEETCLWKIKCAIIYIISGTYYTESSINPFAYLYI